MDGMSKPGTRLSTDQLIKEMYKVLPADSYRHIAQKVRRNTGIYVSVPDITRAIFVLRQKADQYGWHVPHCKRGRSSKDRLFVQFGASDVSFDPSTNERFQAGLFGTLSHGYSMSANAPSSLRTAIAQMPTLAGQKRATALLRDLDYISAKIWDMREDCRQEDSGTT